MIVCVVFPVFANACHSDELIRLFERSDHVFEGKFVSYRIEPAPRSNHRETRQPLAKNKRIRSSIPDSWTDVYTLEIGHQYQGELPPKIHIKVVSGILAFSHNFPTDYIQMDASYIFFRSGEPPFNWYGPFGGRAEYWLGHDESMIAENRNEFVRKYSEALTYRDIATPEFWRIR